MVAEGLLTDQEYSRATDSHLELQGRANELVSAILTRIELDPVNYHAFVRILAENGANYRDMLRYFDIEMASEDPSAASSDPQTVDQGTATQTGLLI